MVKTPQISVIVPCFNQAHFLQEALGSVLAQTLPDWECIIVNDGATDNTAAVAQKWTLKDSRFRYIEKANGGLSSARNRGLAESCGEFVQFLDADDAIEPLKFEWQAKALVDHPNIGIVCGDLRYFSTESPSQRRFTLHGPDEPWLEQAWLDPRPILVKLLERNLMAVNCPLIRRSVINRVGAFDERLRSVEDWHFWLRCAVLDSGFHFAPAPETLALVRIHNASMSQDRTRMQEASCEMTLLIGPLLADKQLKLRNFELGVNRILTKNQSFTDIQLLRLAFASRGGDIFSPLLRVFSGRYPRLAKWLSLLNKTAVVRDAKGIARKIMHSSGKL